MKTFATYALATVLTVAGHSAASGVQDTCGGQSSSNLVKAETVITGGPLYTMNYDFDIYSEGAIAVMDGAIVWVGRAQDLNASVNTQGASIIDTKGSAIMPGLIDSHMHSLYAGWTSANCNLGATPLLRAEFRAQLQSCLDADTTSGKDDLFSAFQWNRSGFVASNGRDVTSDDLEGLSDRPIMVKSTDGHSSLPNKRALELANITSSTPNPEGGIIDKDSSGALTGVVEDNAQYIIAAITSPSTAQDHDSAVLAQSILNSQGITTIMDAASFLTTHIPVYAALFEAGNLTTRFFASLLIQDPAKDDLDGLMVNFTKARDTYDTGNMTAAPGVSIHSTKVFMDGVITYPSNTGAMLEPYLTPDPSNSSSQWISANVTIDPYVNRTRLQSIFEQIMSNDFNIQLHCDGDAAVRYVLDAVEALPYRLDDNRLALAHAEAVALSDYPRFKDLNVRLIMTYQWAQDSDSWHSLNGSLDTAHSVGPERSLLMEPFGNLTDMENNVVYGSDWPIDNLDPFLALQVGVTRMGSLEDTNSQASQFPQYYKRWDTQSTLSRVTAMRGTTTYGAEWLHASSQIGSLDVGKFADIIITENNYFDLNIPDSSLANNAVLVTMVGGKVVYAPGGNSRTNTNAIQVPASLWDNAAVIQQEALTKINLANAKKSAVVSRRDGGCTGHAFM